jgi:hypothetical protein
MVRLRPIEERGLRMGSQKWDLDSSRWMCGGNRIDERQRAKLMRRLRCIERGARYCMCEDRCWPAATTPTYVSFSVLMQVQISQTHTYVFKGAANEGEEPSELEEKPMYEQGN